jgi:hypothetical protein
VAFFAFPGPACLKLLPIAGRFCLGEDAIGVVMNPKERNFTDPKLVFPLPPAQTFQEPVPLAAIYVLTPPAKSGGSFPVIGQLTEFEALMKVLRFTHNDRLCGPERLQRHLESARLLASAVCLRTLSYPRVLTSLRDVKNAVLADLHQQRP